MPSVLMAIVSGEWFLQVGAVSLALVAALAYLRHLRRDRAPGRGDTVALTGQHTLHVVEFDGRRMVIGTGPSGAPRFVCDLVQGDGVGSAAGSTQGGD
jgi:hypothetical protein